MKRLLVLAVVTVVAGCASEAASPGPTAAPSTGEEVTVSTTPRPDEATAAELETAIAGIYPGVPDGKATDWAVSTCQQILTGTPRATLEANVARRYSGGNRPDPTPDQARAILAAIESAGFCR